MYWKSSAPVSIVLLLAFISSAAEGFNVLFVSSFKPLAGLLLSRLRTARRCPNSAPAFHHPPVSDIATAPGAAHRRRRRLAPPSPRASVPTRPCEGAPLLDSCRLLGPAPSRRLVPRSSATTTGVCARSVSRRCCVSCRRGDQDGDGDVGPRKPARRCTSFFTFSVLFLILLKVFWGTDTAMEHIMMLGKPRKTHASLVKLS